MRPLGPSSGYTLIELIVAVGLFALVMVLASGGYLMVIAANRQAQALSTGSDNLAFGLETMTRTIRTGTNYACSFPAPSGGNCSGGANTFYVTDPSGTTVGFTRSTSASDCGGSTSGCLVEIQGATRTALTNAAVSVSAVTFYASGVYAYPTDAYQPQVTIVVSGTVSSGPGKTVPFTVETGATMRGTDL